RIYNGETYCTVVDTSSGVFDSFSSFSLNDAGTVAVRALLTAGGERILTGRCGPLTTIATTGRTFSHLGVDATTGPVINAAGSVAFVATLTEEGEGVFLSSDGRITTIAGTTDGFRDFHIAEGQPRPSLSDDGTVVFFARTDEGEGLYTRRGPEGAIRTVARTTGNSPFSGLATAPGINNQGMVAFRGVLREGGGGIFTGPDSERDKVIRTGEPLFGSTVTSVGFFG